MAVMRGPGKVTARCTPREVTMRAVKIGVRKFLRIDMRDGRFVEIDVSSGTDRERLRWMLRDTKE